MKKVILFASVLVAGLLSAETLTITKPEQITPSKNIMADDKGVLTFKGTSYSYSTQIFDFDPSKKYTVSGDFRQVAGKSSAVIFFGFQPLAANNREILMPHTQIIPGTDTELTADVAPGAKEIRVKNAAKWRKGYRFAVNTDPALKDLPNFSVIHSNSLAAVQEGDDWKVTFAQPIRIALKKGTRVRQHGLGGAMYPAAPAVRISREWKTYAGSASGIYKTHGYTYNKFPIGTAKVKMIIFVNYGQKDAVTEVKNLTLKAE